MCLSTPAFEVCVCELDSSWFMNQTCRKKSSGVIMPDLIRAAIRGVITL